MPTPTWSSCTATSKALDITHTHDSHEHDPVDLGHDHHGHADGHTHEPDHGGHEHGHEHHGGLRGFVTGLFRPHSHDAADSVDSALEASAQGVRAVKISLAGLGVTALLQLLVVAVSGSVALLADTIHNFSDVLTAVPLWIAFIVGRRAATRRYTYGYGRAEDLAGLFIVAMIALSAVIAGVEAVGRLVDPAPVQHVGWVALAGLIGFLGNELVAIYRIRVGRQIGSAALVADGLHARTDGFTSLAVLAGAGGRRGRLPARGPDHRPDDHGGHPRCPPDRCQGRLPAADGRRRPRPRRPGRAVVAHHSGSR